MASIVALRTLPVKQLERHEMTFTAALLGIFELRPRDSPERKAKDRTAAGIGLDRDRPAMGLDDRA
jgi:hypothetical protein